MSTDATVTRMVEAALYVRDLDRSAAFYEDLFGFATESHDEQICRHCHVNPSWRRLADRLRVAG